MWDIWFIKKNTPMGNAINQLIQLVIPFLTGILAILTILVITDRLITKKNDNGKQNNN